LPVLSSSLFTSYPLFDAVEVLTTSWSKHKPTTGVYIVMETHSTRKIRRLCIRWRHLGSGWTSGWKIPRARSVACHTLWIKRMRRSRWRKGYSDLPVWNRIPAILIAYSSCKELFYLITNENRREKLLRYFLYPFLNFPV
jgi:hypothetical protein